MVYVQKKELEFAKNPLPCQCIAYESRKISLVPPWERIEDNFEIIDGDYTLAEGIELIFLPGHTPGSMGVSVNTEKGKYLIAGDLIQSNIVFDEMPCGLPKPSGVHINLEEYYESLKKVMKYGDYILPSHDFKVLENLVYPPKI